MPGRLQGKKVFVTGAARGLGAAIASACAAEGAKVALADIAADGAAARANEINAAHGAGTAFAYALDVTDEAQWIAVLEAAHAAMGGISGLVNNAGISGGTGSIEELEFDKFKRVMSVNVESVFLGAKHTIKYLAKNQPGSIVNISSVNGLVSEPFLSVYTASELEFYLFHDSYEQAAARRYQQLTPSSDYLIDYNVLQPSRDEDLMRRLPYHNTIALHVPAGRAELVVKALSELRTYIMNNWHMIPNYGERYRNGEPIATGFVESTVNEVVSKRFCKKQQMQWSKEGAHLLLQTRVRTLNGELSAIFKRWYPDMDLEVEEMPVAA